MLSPDSLRQSLTRVIDPELFLNIVDLGLVYGIEVNPDQQVTVTMTMTTPHCPMGPQIIKDVTETVQHAGATSVNVNVVWEPAWSIAFMTPALRAELGLDDDEAVLPIPPPPPPPSPLPAKKPGWLTRLFGR